MAKKKLPTGPIKISSPVNRTHESTKPESANLESKIQESNLQDLGIQENSTQETKNQKSSILESDCQATSNLDSINLETTSQESSLQDSGIQDFTKIEYKKISMRLSTNAASKLREFRTETGIPYEILVDVLVRNWENLPNRTKNAYLNEAKGIRSKRLIAGQQKTMATMQSKYQVD